MTVMMTNPNAKRVKRVPAEKVLPPAGEIEGDGPGWKDVEPPAKKAKASKPAPAEVAAKVKAKAAPVVDQPTDKKPKAKAKAEPKAKPKAKAAPKAPAKPKAKAPAEVKPEKVKTPRRSKGRRPPPEPVEGKVTKILLRLTANDVRDIDLHRGELTRPGYIHHLMRVGVASKGRRATDPS